MLDSLPHMTAEPESYVLPLYFKGAGATAPSLVGRDNVTVVAHASTGVIKVTFNDDPGPTFLGIQGFCFGDPTVANVAGWTVVQGAYVAPSGSTPASLTITTCNSTFAAADLPATSTLGLSLEFKRASAKL